ncbi:MAG TPA: hypothetical protein VFD21_07805, partial [Vicinamibacterales bacterium]|nr:hypothetical protein [Vicinamibacterales bacterium]
PTSKSTSTRNSRFLSANPGASMPQQGKLPGDAARHSASAADNRSKFTESWPGWSVWLGLQVAVPQPWFPG